MSVKENKLKQKIEMVIEKADSDFKPILTFLKTISEMNGQKVEGNIESFSIEGTTDWCSKVIERINIRISTVTEDRLVLLDDKTIEVEKVER